MQQLVQCTYKIAKGKSPIKRISSIIRELEIERNVQTIALQTDTRNGSK